MNAKNHSRAKLAFAAGIFARGACMGVADLVPGVSGGTIAFVSGIYDRLLAAVGAWSRPQPWKLLMRGKIPDLWRHADGVFVASLLAGIICAALALSGVLHNLLETRLHLLLGFFLGLVLASAAAVALRMRSPEWTHLPLFLFGAALGAAVLTLSPSGDFSPDLLALFFCGAAAICAMILPGISGSYILLILGAYPTVIAALKERDILTLSVFAAGCGLGLLLFARVLTFLLRRHRDGMTATLVGVMLGAAPKLWPWKESAAGAKAILFPNVSPSDFSGDPQIALTATLGISGALLVFAIDALSRTRTKTQTTEARETKETREARTQEKGGSHTGTRESGLE